MTIEQKYLDLTSFFILTTIARNTFGLLDLNTASGNDNNANAVIATIAMEVLIVQITNQTDIMPASAKIIETTIFRNLSI